MEKDIAVIGGGYWGKNLVRNFAEMGALHTICDSSPQTLSQLAKQYPDARRESDLTVVLADPGVKGVVIATPAATHYAIAKQALLSGKDVFVEKPLALEVKEGEELVKLADSLDRVLMVGHILEYHPAVVKLKSMVDRGELGKINYIYSSRLNLGKFRTEENILWSFAPHDISVILLLLNELPREVSAHGGNYLHDNVADITVTNLSFASGAKAHIFVSWLHPYKEQKLVVIGDKAMAVFDDVSSDRKLLLYRHAIEWVNRLPVPHQKDAVPVPFEMAEPLRLECEHFLECLKTRSLPRTDGRSALRVLRVLDAGERSLSGRSENVALATGETGFFVHPSSLLEKGCTVGEGTKIWHFCHLMPSVTIGKNCNIGQNVFIGENVSISDNVRLQNNVSVYDGVTLEDNVFCGPSCVFTNVKVPRSHISQGGKYSPTRVKRGATIGANATIVCGNTIGRYAIIGAGSVVTRDIPDHALVYGNPARLHGWVCACGGRLEFNDTAARCPQCGKGYTRSETRGEVTVRGE